VSWELILVEQDEAYPNHGEESANGSKGGLGGRNTTGVLGNIQDTDERIQCRGNAVAPSRLWGIRNHRGSCEKMGCNTDRAGKP
jgi:hypothetical protein